MVGKCSIFVCVCSRTYTHTQLFIRLSIGLMNSVGSFAERANLLPLDIINIHLSIYSSLGIAYSKCPKRNPLYNTVTWRCSSRLEQKYCLWANTSNSLINIAVILYRKTNECCDSYGQVCCTETSNNPNGLQWILWATDELPAMVIAKFHIC